MKIFLYILLGVFVLLIVFILWFNLVYAKVPLLKLAASAGEEEKIKAIDAYLSALHENGKFNGGVLLAKANTALLMKTYGFTDHLLEEKLSKQSSFRLASVSKQFTAAAVLRAQALGLLDIDHRVREYLSEFPYPEVSIRHLLNHTSGVPDNYMKLAEEHLEEIGEVLTITGVVGLVTRAAEAAQSNPGEVFAYSNTNYVLLAGVIEAVSGQSFETFLQEQLFLPLGMGNSRVWNLVSADSTFKNKTESFVLYGKVGKALHPDFLDGVAGDGAVFASIEDMLIWDRFWKGNELIPDRLLQQAFLPAKVKKEGGSKYGFGWILENSYEWHNGSWLGAMTFIARSREKETFFVLLDNSENIRLQEVAKEILAVWKTL